MQTDTAVAEFHHIFGLGLDEFTVDADLADLVDNHSEPKIGLFFQDVIQQRRFACTEKPGEDADRDHFSRRHKKETKKSDLARKEHAVQVVSPILKGL